MIPLKIHYCWLSGERFPPAVESCLASWRRIMPDYELCCWDGNRFDVNSVPFVAEACEARKWAFAADYIRLHALHEEGGVYLDVDVLVKQRLDPFLENRFFSALEVHEDYVRAHHVLDLLHPDGTPKIPRSHIPGIAIQAAVLGAERGHPFLMDCMNWYRERHFRNEDGGAATELLAPDILAQTAESYGFKYRDADQCLREGMRLYPSKLFAATPRHQHPGTVAVHLCLGSWREPVTPDPKPKGLHKLKRSLQKRFEHLRRLIGRHPK